MHVPVFPSTEMLRVLVHRNLGTVEYGGFVHVVPGKEVEGRTLVVLGQHFLRPEFSDFGVKEVKPNGRTYETSPSSLSFHKLSYAKSTQIATAAARVRYRELKNCSTETRGARTRG